MKENTLQRVCILIFVVVTTGCQSLKESSSAEDSKPVPVVEPRSTEKVDIEIALTDCEEQLSEKLEINPKDATLLCEYLDRVGGGDQPYKALAEWLNNSSKLEESPIQFVVRGQLEAAIASTLEFNRLTIAPAVRTALSQKGYVTKQALNELDVESFLNSDELFDALQELVFDGLLAANYAGLNALVVNPWQDIDLYVDGIKLGEIEKSPAGKVKRFCLWLPDNETDGNRFVDIGIKFPTDTDGNDGLRYQSSVELEKGVSAVCRISPYPTPALSIGIRSQNSTNTPVVLAGDVVYLTLESPIESELTDIVWIELGGRDTDTLSAENIINPPTGSTSAKGLMAWLELRRLIKSDWEGNKASAPTTQRGMQQSVLNGRFDEERIVGFGSQITWSPRVESPEIGLVALARNQEGLWGIVKRSVAVIDLRPAVWAIPQADVEIDPVSLQKLNEQSSWSDSSTVELVSKILEEVKFQVPTATPVNISLRTSPLSEAQMPLEQTVVDFGDGSPPVNLEGRTAISHTWQSSGEYVLKVTATGIDGISRVISSKVTAAAASLPEVKLEPKAEAKIEQPRRGPAESSSELFARTAKEWTEKLAQAATVPVQAHVQDGKYSIEVSHIHAQLQRPVVELFDGHLVSSLIDSGYLVHERDRVFTEAVKNYGSIASRDFFGAAMNNEPDQLLKEKFERWLLDNNHSVETEEFLKVLGLYRELNSEQNNFEDSIDPSSKDEEPSVVQPRISQLVLAYKLSKAEVKVSEVGADLAVRNCEIRGFARVINKSTNEVIFSKEITASISGLISEPALRRLNSGGWSDQPSDWMLNSEPEVTWELPIPSEE